MPRPEPRARHWKAETGGWRSLRRRYEDSGSLANVLCLYQIDASSGAPRQADREFGKFSRHAVDGDRAAVLLHDDVIGDRQAEPGALPGRFRRNEGLEQFLPDLRR